MKNVLDFQEKEQRLQYSQKKEVRNKNNSIDEWEEPIELEEKNLAEFDTGVFPTWVKNYVESVAEVTQTPVDALAFSLISSLSSILSKKFEVNIIEGEWIETLNTYTALALESGNRKSSVFNYFIKPISNYEAEKRKELKTQIIKQKERIKAKEARIAYLRTTYSKKGGNEILDQILLLREELENEDIIIEPKYFTSDATPEQLAIIMSEQNEKIALLSSEGGEVFEMIAGRYGECNVDLYLKAYSGDPVDIERVSRQRIRLEQPEMTIGLFLQQSVIKNLPENFSNRGLTQRFLYSFPRSFLGQRKIKVNQMSKEVKKTFNENIKKLLELETKKPIKLTLSEEAKDYEIKIRTEIEELLNDKNESEHFRSWLSKLAGQILRIAGLLHVANHVSDNIRDIQTVIDVKTLKKAYSLRDYFIKHAKKAYGIMKVDTDTEELKYLLEKICEKANSKNGGEIAYRDIVQSTRRKFPNTDRLQIRLKQLEDNYLISNKRLGRKKYICLNPKYKRSTQCTR